MRILATAMTFVIAFAALPRPVLAAQPASTSAATHRSVGSRLDAPLAPAKSKAVDRVPYRVPDQAAFARAKREAAGRAGGLSPLARSDFAISATPSSRSVVQGASTTYTVNTQATSGSARPVALSLSGLPAGASGAFNPSSVTAGGSATLTVTTSPSAATGTFTLTIRGDYTSPPTTHTTTVSLAVTPLPPPDDFSISVTPSSGSVLQGASTTYSVATQVTSGNAQTVTFSVSGLPAGATGAFNPASVTAGGTSTLTVTTASSTPVGTSTFTITGTSATATHATSASLTVTAPVLDDFSISATPSSQGVLQGASTTYTVTTQVTSGNAQSVTLSLAGLPAGASGTFNPASIVAGGTSTLTVTTTGSTPAGTSTLTITGTGTSAAHSTSVTLTVSLPVPDDFSVNATPASQSVVQGGSTTYSVTTQVTSGNAQSVALSVSGLPLGATGTFNPSTITAGGSSTLTVSTTTTATVGTVTVVITGTGSSATRSTSVSFTVTPLPPDEFALTAIPTLRSVVQGASATYNVDTQVTSGNAQSISLSVSGVPAGATGTLNPPTVTAGGSSVLTVATTTATAVGSYTLTVTGLGSAGPSHSATVVLEVTAPSSGPTIGVSWNGQNESDLAPPDPTGAMGPNSFIQLINLRYGIYRRDSTLIQEGDLGMLTRFPVSELTDPQIVWDPTSRRFYYLVLDFYTSQFAFGYSKNADPQSDDEFCHYQIGAFYNPFYLPDYPKLAVTRDFVLIGSNVFLLFSFYNGSDVNWFEKPTDPVCPSQLGAGGTFSALKNADGSLMSTPEPAVMLDASSDGWIVGSNDVSTSGGADYLTVFKVTKSANGQAQLSAPMTVGVPQYQMPANAPQSGTTQLLDTMDTRLTHAVAGYDPRIGATAIWTAHTVFGGAGAEVRWFEISTAGGAPSLSQTGTVSDPELYVFNGAASSDRAADDVTSSGAATGSNVVVGFNTSSASTYSAIKMVSQRGTAPQSGVVIVKRSDGPYVDFGCGSSVPDVCRWGDYGGAYADPLVANGGQVWLSNEWNEPATDGSTPTWRTWNWSARP